MKIKYVPILRWKQGEQSALQELSREVKNSIIPMIEFTGENNNCVESCWDEREFYSYFMNFTHNNNLSEYQEIFEVFNSDYMIPVIDKSVSDRILSFLSRSKERVGIRLYIENFGYLNRELTRYLGYFEASNIDLIIDCKNIEHEDIRELTTYICRSLEGLDSLEDYNSIIITSSSMPESIKDLPAFRGIELNRSEREIFNNISENMRVYNQNIIYSDYTIKNSIYNIIDSDYIRFYVNIKYTLEDCYLCVKGRLNDDGGLRKENIISMCEIICNDERFCGRDFSWGDKYIYERRKECDEINKFGNPTTWVKVCINHHITYIVESLNN